MNTTIRTTATIRVMLSHAYCNFEAIINLENPDGVSNDDIEKARIDCQAIAIAGVNDHKANPLMNPKEELKRIENKLTELKKHMGRIEADEPPVDPEEIKAIESLPLYDASAGKKGKKEAAKPKTK